MWLPKTDGVKLMNQELYDRLLDIITFCHLQMDDRRDKLAVEHMLLYYELQSKYKKEAVCQVAKDLIDYKERDGIITRCSDCIYNELTVKETGAILCSKHMSYLRMKEDSFCSYGIPKKKTII